MPFTQIDDMLCFDGEVVKAKGTLVLPQDLNLDPGLHENLNPDVETISDEHVKTFWVRVCQGEHTGDELRAHIAEASASDDSFVDRGRWALDCPIRDGDEFHAGEATVTATLVYETDDDLLTLTWAECVHLLECEES
jgi:hypothetical protein